MGEKAAPPEGQGRGKRGRWAISVRGAGNLRAGACGEKTSPDHASATLPSVDQAPALRLVLVQITHNLFIGFPGPVPTLQWQVRVGPGICVSSQLPGVLTLLV